VVKQIPVLSESQVFVSFHFLSFVSMFVFCFTFHKGFIYLQKFF